MNKATYSAFAVLMAAGLSIAADAQAREHGVTQAGERGATQARVTRATTMRERGVNEHQFNQRERVAAGVRSGQVTRPESRQLHHETRGIERKEQAFRAAGHFSRGERREVQHDLNRHSRNIHQARTDQHGRGWHGGRDWGHQRGLGQGHNAQGASGIDRQQHRQQAQIRQGVRNGSLTPHEARRLQGEQPQIAGLERSYRADGVLTRDERRDLQGELRDASRHIYNQSHDDDRRFRR